MSEKETSLVFTGDLGFDKYMAGKWTDEELLSKEIKEFLRSGDHLIVNVEGPLSDGKKNTSLDPAAAKLIHSMDPAVADFLVKNGADIWNICNNHIMDAGPEGLSDTLAIAKEKNVKTIGAGMNLSEAMAPIILNEAGGIGMFGVGYQRACRKAGDDAAGCFSWSDMENIKRTIEEIKKTCRWCIVVAHGGEEFTSLPNRYVRKRYMDYLSMGADIVVSHHPHVPMNYETFPGKAIFYSLGNFIFDTDYQRSQFNTEFGILLKLNFTKEDFTFDASGLKIDRDREKVVRSELPDIFTDVCEEEYEKLEPLAAKQFIEATKRQLKYMKPDKFNNATEEDFKENFYEPLRSGRVPEEVLDMQIVYPISLLADEGKWKESKLESVKKYILDQI
jgi:poly-gamma-glutamate synthesis protein (capsule biosynthesis protein)